MLQVVMSIDSIADPHIYAKQRCLGSTFLRQPLAERMAFQCDDVCLHAVFKSSGDCLKHGRSLPRLVLCYFLAGAAGVAGAEIADLAAGAVALGFSV